MALPNLPVFHDMSFTTGSGSLTPEAHSYMDSTFQTLNELVDQVNNGLIISNKTTAEIAELAPTAKLGTMWFNTTLAKLQVLTVEQNLPTPFTIETVTSV